MSRFFCGLGCALALGSVSIAGCDDNPAPKTAHAARGTRGNRAKRQQAAAKPAKRFGDFQLHVDRSPFLAAGCLQGHSENTLDCHAAAFVTTFGCEPEVIVEDLLGGLKTSLAVVECRVPGDSGGVAQVGCRRPTARKLVVFENNAFDLIGSADTFRKRFGPPKTAAAALGFALAHARDARAMFDLSFDDPGPVDEDVMASNVLPRAQGWVVRLFERQACGCSHPDFALDVLVNRDGEVSQIARSQIHVDPKTEGVCAD